MTRKIELAKPAPPPYAKGDHFSPGERMILVDGVRWGRTIVSRHGCHGTRHKFQQDGGEVLVDDPNKRYPQATSIRSVKRHHYDKEPHVPTLERVLAKAIELVNSCKLRDPAVVRAEQQAAMARHRENTAKAMAAETENFRARAEMVADPFKKQGLLSHDGHEHLVGRIVEAMRWAQGQ